MGSKIGVFATGMLLGMMVLVACEPLYQRLTEVKDSAMMKINQVKKNTETSLADVKQKVMLKTDDALDSINLKIDDLIKVIDEIDISKVKGKSKMALEAVIQKIMTLKQED